MAIEIVPNSSSGHSEVYRVVEWDLQLSFRIPFRCQDLSKQLSECGMPSPKQDTEAAAFKSF